MFLLVSALLFPLLLKNMFVFLPRLLSFKLFFRINHFNYSQLQVRVKANENSGILLKIIICTLCQFSVETYWSLN